MTSKPMLSVEQELRGAVEKALLAIKRIYQAGHDGIVNAGGSCDQPRVMFEGDPAVREIRAILDKSAYPDRLCHSDKGCHPYICGCFEGDAEAQRRYDDHHRKAAQHQGEPVAWQYMTHPAWDKGAWPIEWTDCTKEAHDDYVRAPLVADWEYRTRKLYAEQPAPVAVKVSWAAVEPWYNENEQMLRDVCKFEGLKGVALEVWRAARLNEVKP